MECRTGNVACERDFWSASYGPVRASGRRRENSWTSCRKEQASNQPAQPSHCRTCNMIEHNSIKAIFLDAVGTLFYLTRTVGEHYAVVGDEIGLKLNADKLNAAFYSAWKQMPLRQAIDGPRENDDKGWWHALMNLVLEKAAPGTGELDADNFFEVAYERFAEAGVWELYPDVIDVLERLCAFFQLAIVSNFDGRLRVILERLGIAKYFGRVFLSSEMGADKPDPEIFRRALKLLDLRPSEVLHVGDDPERDWRAAAGAGLSVFQLDRKKNSLQDIFRILPI